VYDERRSPARGKFGHGWLARVKASRQGRVLSNVPRPTTEPDSLSESDSRVALVLPAAFAIAAVYAPPVERGCSLWSPRVKPSKLCTSFGEGRNLDNPRRTTLA
jgi:hypothetical protein